MIGRSQVQAGYSPFIIVGAQGIIKKALSYRGLKVRHNGLGLPVA